MIRKSFLLALALFSIFWLHSQISAKDPFCAFCNEDVIERQTFYSGEYTLGILTHKPVVQGHVLIIPKRHVERFEDLHPGELVEMHEMIQLIHRAEGDLYGTTSYMLLQKNGVEAGQSVPHVHFHYLPRAKWGGHFLFATRFFLAPMLKPLAPEKMEQERLKMESEIEHLFDTSSSEKFLLKTLERINRVIA